MFISTWKYPFLNDDLARISTGVISSADMTEDLLYTRKTKWLMFNILGKDCHKLKNLKNKMNLKNYRNIKLHNT